MVAAGHMVNLEQPDRFTDIPTIGRGSSDYLSEILNSRLVLTWRFFASVTRTSKW